MTADSEILDVCAVRGNPPGNYHFSGHCEDCDAYFLSRMTLAQVEDGYRGHGIRPVSQDQFEAYMHCWATGAFRYSTLGDGWTDPPTDPAVARIVARIRRHGNERNDRQWPTSMKST